MMGKYVIKNAKIWTAEIKEEWVNCVGIEGENIVFVGREKKLDPEFWKDADILDAGGRVVIPSFVDCHIHVTSVAKSLWYLILERKKYDSFEELMISVKAYTDIHSTKEVPFLYAASCPMELMNGARKEMLDAYVSDRPMLLCDEGFHRCLVNSKMLELMEIDADTPYNWNSSMNYERDATGAPTGIVYEHCYEEDIDKMYEKIAWYPPNQKDSKVVLPFLDMLNGWGVSAVLDGFTESEDTFIGLQKLEQDGRLNMYYQGNALFHNLDDLDQAIANVRNWQKKYASKHIKINTIKLFLDGTNEIGTAAVLEPLLTDPKGKNCGIINMSESDLTEVMLRLQKERLNIQIHLVGDRAFRVAVNAVENAKTQVEAQGETFVPRVTLLHCELTKKEDRMRVADLGIQINCTPHWNGGIFGDSSLELLGSERFNSMYAFQDFIESGAVLSCSSDVVDQEDMKRANPFVGIEIGHTRHDEMTDFGVRTPVEERLSRRDLMLGYTINGAKCMGIDSEMGSIKKGKIANLLILNQDVFTVPAEEIRNTKPDTVIFEGKVMN